MHSGLTLSKCDSILVLKNNAISATNFKANKIKFFQKKRYGSVVKKRSSLVSSHYFKNKLDKPSNCSLFTSPKCSNKEISYNTSSIAKNTCSILHPGLTLTQQEKETSLLKKKRMLHPLKNKLRIASIESLSVNIGSLYKTDEEIRREEYKESKNKWITKFGFMAYGEKHCKGYRMMENYVGKDPSEPSVLHNFRPVDKNKWISGVFKLP